MSNDVIKETEESQTSEISVSEDQTQVTSAETAADENLSEQQTSADEDFGSILEKFEQDQTIFHTGETVKGKVIGISDHGVIVDFGYKSEGIVPLEEFTTPDGEIFVTRGDEVEVVIKNIHPGDAPPILSRNDVLRRKSWDVIEAAYNDGTPITGLVMDKTKGGLRVDINGIEAFLPGSLADSRPSFNLDSFRGKEIEARVIKFSRKRNNIVLSRKALTDEVINKQKGETLGKIEQGYVIEGVIKNLTEYGAFVDIGGIDGLLHVTDMSWGRLQNPAELFKVGDNVQVKVLKLDKEKEKVSLGYKQLIPDPWSSVVEIYPVGAKVSGKVSSVAEYGAFVELEPGVEGLVHVSEMSWSKRSKSPKQLLKPGEEVEVQVLGVDTDDRRISLGMRQLQPNPWESLAGKYRVGMTVNGKVRNITDFGAFIELEDGIDGLVHVSDISRSKKVRHPKDMLKRGQDVQAVITSLDIDGQRMSLSIKDLAPSSWEAFIADHKAGDVVKGKISRFAGFGVFVELADELEGLCHISELSDERIENPEKIYHIGQEMDFKILRIEYENQKVGLSHRAVGKEDEPVVDYKSYSTEAKGGMASLAELANLKFPSAKTEEPKDVPKKPEPKAEKAAAPVEAAKPDVSTEIVSEEKPAAEEKSIDLAEIKEEPGAEEAVAEKAEVEEPTETVAETETVKTEEPGAQETKAAETKEVAAAAETKVVETEEPETVEASTVETAEESLEEVEEQTAKG
ncbi:MAG: 30S ribosomal protein S1 [Actinomycetota bacterium]